VFSLEIHLATISIHQMDILRGWLATFRHIPQFDTAKKMGIHINIFNSVSKKVGMTKGWLVGRQPQRRRPRLAEVLSTTAGLEVLIYHHTMPDKIITGSFHLQLYETSRKRFPTRLVWLEVEQASDDLIRYRVVINEDL
jgi:hypothetical protein